MAVIYAIQNNLTNAIVHVGQTTNFKQRKIAQIQTLLQESSISMKDLAQQFNCTYQTISYINSGRTHLCDSFLYPLRSYK